MDNVDPIRARMLSVAELIKRGNSRAASREIELLDRDLYAPQIGRRGKRLDPAKVFLVTDLLDRAVVALDEGDTQGAIILIEEALTEWARGAQSPARAEDPPIFRLSGGKNEKLIDAYDTEQIAAVLEMWGIRRPIDVAAFLVRADIPNDSKERVRMAGMALYSSVTSEPDDYRRMQAQVIVEVVKLDQQRWRPLG